MKAFISLLLVCFCTTMALSQEVVLSTGLSIHSLRKLKNLQTDFNGSVVVPVESTQSFPPFLQYQIQVRWAVKSKTKVGVSLFTTSTAARSVYQDYSGIIQLDQSLSCFGFAAYSNYLINQTGKSRFGLYSEMGILASTMDAVFNVTVLGDPDISRDTFNATSFMMEVGTEYKYMISDELGVNFTFGLHLTNSGRLKSTMDESYEKVNWTGAKILVGLCYQFKKKV